MADEAISTKETYTPGEISQDSKKLELYQTRPISDEYAHLKTAKGDTRELIKRHKSNAILGLVIAAIVTILTGALWSWVLAIAPLVAYVLVIGVCFLYYYWTAPRRALNQSCIDLASAEERHQATDSELKQALAEVALLRSHLQNFIPKDRAYITGNFKDWRTQALTKLVGNDIFNQTQTGTEVFVLFSFVNESPVPTTIQTFTLQIIINEGQATERTDLSSYPDTSQVWFQSHVLFTPQDLFRVRGRCVDLVDYVGDPSKKILQGERIEGMLSFSFEGFIHEPQEGDTMSCKLTIIDATNKGHHIDSFTPIPVQPNRRRAAIERYQISVEPVRSKKPTNRLNP